MQTKQLHLREIAKLFHVLDGHSSPGEERIYQRLRVMQQEGQIIPNEMGRVGQGTSSKYGLYEICKARLLLRLRDMSVPYRSAQEAFNRLIDASHGSDEKLLVAINGCYPPRGLDAAIANVADENWIADFLVIEDFDIGSTRIHGQFRRSDLPRIGINHPDLVQQRQSKGLVTSGVWLEVTALLRELCKTLSTNDEAN